eukprot:g3575.t1
MKRGSIPPGTCETIFIDFLPFEWKYYYDRVLIRCGRKRPAIVVPIHGYPISNNLKGFPKRIDFGRCPLGRTTIKQFTISCPDVPIDFEYALRVPDENNAADFEIQSSLRGVVSAKESQTIRIAFTPLKLATVTQRIELSLPSQFGFNPVTCVLSGSSVSGIVRNRAVQRVLAKSPTHFSNMEDPNALLAPSPVMMTGNASSSDANNRQHKEGATTSTTTISTKSTSLTVLPKIDVPVRRGAGPDDAGATVMYRRHKRLHTRLAKRKADADRRARVERNAACNRNLHDDEVIVDGLRVLNARETERSSLRAVNFVLTQEPGKMKLKDMKRAIERRRRQHCQNKTKRGGLESAESSTHDTASLTTTTVDMLCTSERHTYALANDGGGGATHHEGSTEEAGGDLSNRAIREGAFLRDITLIEREERRREFATAAIVLGEKIMTKDEIAKVRSARESAERTFRARQRSRDLGMIETVAEGPHDPRSPVRVQVVLPSPAAKTGANSGDDIDTTGLTPPTPPLEKLHFDEYENDMWATRKRVISRFTDIVTRLVVRRRVDKRIRAIRARIGGANATKADVAKIVFEFAKAEQGGACVDADGGDVTPEAASPRGRVLHIPPEALSEETTWHPGLVLLQERPKDDDAGAIGAAGERGEERGDQAKKGIVVSVPSIRDVFEDLNLHHLKKTRDYETMQYVVKKASTSDTTESVRVAKANDRNARSLRTPALLPVTLLAYYCGSLDEESRESSSVAIADGVPFGTKECDNDDGVTPDTKRGTDGGGAEEEDDAEADTHTTAILKERGIPSFAIGALEERGCSLGVDGGWTSAHDALVREILDAKTLSREDLPRLTKVTENDSDTAAIPTWHVVARKRHEAAAMRAGTVSLETSRTIMTRHHRGCPALSALPAFVETDVAFPLRPKVRGRGHANAAAEREPSGEGRWIPETLQIVAEVTKHVHCDALASSITGSSARLLSFDSDDASVKKYPGTRNGRKSRTLDAGLSEDDLSDTDTDSEGEDGKPLGENERVLTSNAASNLFAGIRMEDNDHAALWTRFRAAGNVESGVALAAEEDGGADGKTTGSLRLSLPRQDSLLVHAKRMRDTRKQLSVRLEQSICQFAERAIDHNSEFIRRGIVGSFEEGK